MPEYCGLIQIENVDGIVYVGGTITTLANPILQGAGEANSNAWVGATNGKSGAESKWAQIGYLWRRSSTGSMQSNIYVEIQAGPDDDTDYFVKYFSGPPAGNHAYAAVLDEFTGTWTFFLDKLFLTSFQHDGWKGITARKTQFTCEINGAGARVLGTEDEPCVFSQCEYEIASTDPEHPKIVYPSFLDDDAWQVLDAEHGGGVGSVYLSMDPPNELSTSRDVEGAVSAVSAAEGSRDVPRGAVDRRGRPQAPDSRVPAPAATATRSPAAAQALQAAHDRLQERMAARAFAGIPIVLSGVDPEDACLLVVLEGEGFRNVGHIQRRLREELGEVPVRLVPGHVDEQNGGAGNQKIRPLQGGAQISSASAGGKSSLGLCGYRVQSGKLGFLTAGHTVGAEHDTIGQPDNDNLVGLVALNAYASSIDIAFVNIILGVDADVFKVWTSTGGFTITHILSDDPERGMDCSIQGAQGGSQAGKISKYINMTIYKGEHPVHGVTLATYPSLAGDSGAPVVSFGGEGAVLLLGIHNGRAQAEGTDYAYFTQSSTFRPLVELAEEPPSS